MFNELEQIKKFKAIESKTVALLSKKGISFSSTDGELPNVVFSKDDKILKMSYHSFYRFSGIACVYKNDGENFIEIIEVTDEMYMNNYIRPSVELFFEEKP